MAGPPRRKKPCQLLPAVYASATSDSARRVMPSAHPDHQCWPTCQRSARAVLDAPARYFRQELPEVPSESLRCWHSVQCPVARQYYLAWRVHRCCCVVACSCYLASWFHLDLRPANRAVVKVRVFVKPLHVSVMTKPLARNCGVMDAAAPMVIGLLSAP